MSLYRGARSHGRPEPRYKRGGAESPRFEEDDELRQRFPEVEEEPEEEPEPEEPREPLVLPITSLLKPGEKPFTQRCRLFVGNLPPEISEDEFRALFSKYGQPGEVFINRDRGFGFIRLESRTLAEVAKGELDGTILSGRPLRIRFATHGAALAVKNLSPVISNELLEEAFSLFGPVERAVVIVDDRGRATGKGFVEFVAKPPARKALERCSEGALILTTTPRPVIVEPMEQFDEEDGLQEKFIPQTQQYHKEREEPPRFAQPGTFEFEYSSRWKAIDEMEKQQRNQVEKNMREAKDKLDADMDAAKQEHQLMLMRQDLMRRQEELRRLEELRNHELQKRKQFQMRHEEERRRREEEIMRQREQEEMRRQGFNPNFMDNREQEMRMGDMGLRGAIIMGDTFSPVLAGSQGPPPMMSMNMINRPAVPGTSLGPGPSMGSEGATNIGATNIGAAVMADNGTAIMYGCSVSRREEAVLLLDVAKTFDTVGLAYLWQILARVSCGPWFISWVKLLYMTPTSRVHAHGQSSSQFSHFRGTSQGCHLLPLLFILMMEPLALHVCSSMMLQCLRELATVCYFVI